MKPLFDAGLTDWPQGDRRPRRSLVRRFSVQVSGRKADVGLVQAVRGHNTGGISPSPRASQGHSEIERWLLVGHSDSPSRIRASSRDGTIEIAEVLSARSATAADPAAAAKRVSLLGLLQGSNADRVVLMPEAVLDHDGRALLWTLRSLGARISLVADGIPLGSSGCRPRPRWVGGLELFDVGDRADVGGAGRPTDREPRVSAVITTLNEAESLPQVLERLPGGISEVVLVDGRSTDGTPDVAKAVRPDIHALTQFGRGKGDALRAGFAAAGGDIIVALDADGSTAPEEIPRFVESLIEGADFVKASRLLEGGGSDDITRGRLVGNRALTQFFNLLYGTHYTDLCYGYNAFWRTCLADLALAVPGFEIEAAMHARAALSGLRVREVPSFERSRIAGEGSLVPVRDGPRVLWTIIAERLLSLRQSGEVPYDMPGLFSEPEPAPALASAARSTRR